MDDKQVDGLKNNSNSLTIKSLKKTRIVFRNRLIIVFKVWWIFLF